MPPSREALRQAIERHFACWNARDREGWIALFDPGVVFEDPVGVPPKRGLEAARLQWDRSFTPGQACTLEARLLYLRGSDAAFVAANQFQAKEMAQLSRPGDFFDFTRYRPMLYLEERVRRVKIPNTTLSYAKRENGNDFLFLRLLEPHSRGEDFVDSVLELLKVLRVKRYCLLGSMYDAVPHTKPLLINGRATGKGAEQDLKRAGVQPSNYQGPTTITYLIAHKSPELGIETATFIVSLPQYVNVEEDYLGKVRLLEILNLLDDIPIDKKAILAINVFTGAVVKTFKNDTGITAMNFSIPSAVALIDADDDGFVDKVYVATWAGSCGAWASSLNSSGTALAFPDCDENSHTWEARVIFVSDPSFARKFYYPPSLTLEKSYDLLFIGTGDREDACSPLSTDRFYAVKDKHAAATYFENDLGT